MALELLLAWLYPPRCQHCGRLDPQPLCADCLAQLPDFTAPRCRRCGVFLDPLARTDTCADCRARRRDPLALARSAAPYQGLVRHLIQRLKYARRREAAEALALVAGLWLADDSASVLALDFTAAAGLVPVPLHYLRRFRRGFNQAELLADKLAGELALPVLPMLRRVRATRPQVGLTVAARRRNVAGAFETLPDAVTPNAYYILVDDVYTTGATLRECARMLRRAGAGQVAALTMAHRVDREFVAKGRR